MRLRRAVFAICGALFWAAPALAAVRVGDRAPDFRLKGLDNRDYALSDFRGRVVFLNFLGYSCKYCIQDGPSVEKNIHQMFREQKGFQALGVDVWDGPPSDVQRYFVDLTKTSYPVLLKGSHVGGQYGVDRGTYLVIDQEGTVRYVSPGSTVDRFNDAAFAGVIRSLLQREPTNTPPRIVFPIPNQRGVGTQPIVLDLTGFGADSTDSSSSLTWRAEGVDPALVSVSAQEEGRVLTFTPAPGGVGRDVPVRLVLSDSKGATAEQGITLRWTPAPALSASTEGLDFGSVPVGAARELRLTVSNVAAPGGLDLRVRLTVSDPRFALSDTSVTVSAGGRRDIAVIYRPSGAEVAAHDLTMLTNDPARGALRVSLRGAGILGQGSGTAQPASDFDGDGVVGLEDFFLFAGAFGGRDEKFDLDRSGAVDFNDFFLFAADFGSAPGGRM
jgi:peroxiredoxin